MKISLSEKEFTFCPQHNSHLLNQPCTPNALLQVIFFLYLSFPPTCPIIVLVYFFITNFSKIIIPAIYAGNLRPFAFCTYAIKIFDGLAILNNQCLLFTEKSSLNGK